MFDESLTRLPYSYLFRKEPLPPISSNHLNFIKLSKNIQNKAQKTVVLTKINSQIIKSNNDKVNKSSSSFISKVSEYKTKNSLVSTPNKTTERFISTEKRNFKNLKENTLNEDQIIKPKELLWENKVITLKSPYNNFNNNILKRPKLKIPKPERPFFTPNLNVLKKEKEKEKFEYREIIKASLNDSRNSSIDQEFRETVRNSRESSQIIRDLDVLEMTFTNSYNRRRRKNSQKPVDNVY